VARASGRVLVAFHRDASRVSVVEWVTANLTVPEQDAIRAGYNIGPVGTPVPEWMLTPFPVVGYVPEALRCDGDPALQGVDLDGEARLMYEREAVDLIERGDLLESA
jgi:hypothetical protein